MPLANEIRDLRQRTMDDLARAHDHFSDSMYAWEIVQTTISRGFKFVRKNPATGTTIGERDLIGHSQNFGIQLLAESTFQNFISIFENFLFDFLRLWLKTYPQSLTKKSVNFQAILDAADRNEIILAVVNKELNEVMYERPASWFAYLEERARLGCPDIQAIERIAEAKASRDVLVHNRGVVGHAYIVKSGSQSRHVPGERIDIPEPYHREVWDLLRKVVADVCDSATLKLLAS